MSSSALEGVRRAVQRVRWTIRQNVRDWSVSDSKKRAKELGVTGHSALTKDKLITKPRNH
jgi:hypothetical protein